MATPMRLLLGIMLLLASGCGYATQELYPTDYTTIAVPNFENLSFTREVEFELREALIKEIEQRTPYKVVRTPGAADTLLEGTITDVRRPLISREPGTGVPQEIEVTVTINFTWRDLRTGEDLRGYRGFSAVGQYVPVQAAGEFESAARQRAVDRLATDIVSTMRAQEW